MTVVTLEALSNELIPARDVPNYKPFGTKQAGVLVPVELKQTGLHITFTRRSDQLPQHPGEVSFPGGKLHSKDSSLLDAALRETEEEISIPPKEIKVIGGLYPVTTYKTAYAVYPFVGVIDSDSQPQPDGIEATEIIVAEAKQLLESHEYRALPEHNIPLATDVYTLGDTVIWGATARILTDLLQRFKIAHNS